jgi:hypothetical protein
VNAAIVFSHWERDGSGREWYTNLNSLGVFYHSDMASNTDGSPLKRFASPFYTSQGFVYFVSAGSHCDICKSVKIGVSTRKQLLSRLRSIQSANHTRIRLLGVIPISTMLEAERVERDLHSRFDEWARVPHGSLGYEWFSASPEVMDYVKSKVGPIQQGLNGLPNGDLIIKLFVAETPNVSHL